MVAAGATLFVSDRLAVDAAPDDAIMLYEPPAWEFALTTADEAIPEAFVTEVFRPPANVALGPVCAGAVNVTVALGTALPCASVTFTESAVANAVLMAAVCPLPPFTVIFAAAPGLLVSEKLTVFAPGALAATLYVPAMVLAVNAADVASPCALLTAVLIPPANAPLAPAAGAANVTVTPLTGWFAPSVTRTTKGAANAWVTVVVCEDPDEMASKPAVTAVAVTLTVAGLLLEKPLLTINWTT